MELHKTKDVNVGGNDNYRLRGRLLTDPDTPSTVRVGGRERDHGRGERGGDKREGRRETRCAGGGGTTSHRVGVGGVVKEGRAEVGCGTSCSRTGRLWPGSGVLSVPPKSNLKDETDDVILPP